MKILKKMKKKMTGDIITLYICTMNENHMMHVMYGSWDMEHNRQFFLILDNFCPQQLIFKYQQLMKLFISLIKGKIILWENRLNI